MNTEDIKVQFVNFLRSVYGAETQVMDGSLPPLKVGTSFPAFQKPLNQGLGLMAQGMMQSPMLGSPMMQQPMMGSPMMGMQQPMGMGMQQPAGMGMRQPMGMGGQGGMMGNAALPNNSLRGY